MIADRSFLPEYRERSMVLGKPVLVYSGGEPEEAIAEEIDEQGALLVRHLDGACGGCPPVRSPSAFSSKKGIDISGNGRYNVFNNGYKT